MKHDGVLIQTLSRALEWMPNVSRITYSPLPRHLPIEANVMKGLVQRSLSNVPGPGRTSSDHPFRHLVAALYLSQYAGIRELRTDLVDQHSVNPGTEFALGIFDLDDGEMAAAEFLFQGLEKLVLNMALKVSDKSTLGEVAVKFATLLRSTVHLKHFHFHLPSSEPEVGVKPLLARLCLETTWSKLRSLSLKGILADEKQLSGMIKRHKPSLTHVKFSECCLIEGAWADIVDEIVYGSRVHHFVLDRGNERNLPHLNYASLNSWERDSWKYEGYLEVTKDGERSFVSAQVLTAWTVC